MSETPRFREGFFGFPSTQQRQGIGATVEFNAWSW